MEERREPCKCNHENVGSCFRGAAHLRGQPCDKFCTINKGSRHRVCKACHSRSSEGGWARTNHTFAPAFGAVNPVNDDDWVNESNANVASYVDDILLRGSPRRDFESFVG